MIIYYVFFLKYWKCGFIIAPSFVFNLMTNVRLYDWIHYSPLKLNFSSLPRSFVQTLLLYMCRGLIKM